MSERTDLLKQLRLALIAKDKELESLRQRLTAELEAAAVDAMKSNEYNFNDTAVRAKTLYEAAAMVGQKKVTRSRRSK